MSKKAKVHTTFLVIILVVIFFGSVVGCSVGMGWCRVCLRGLGLGRLGLRGHRPDRRTANPKGGCPLANLIQRALCEFYNSGGSEEGNAPL